MVSVITTIIIFTFNTRDLLHRLLLRQQMRMTELTLKEGSAWTSEETLVRKESQQDVKAMDNNTDHHH